jgi:nitroreductase/dihydropteridine reductase
MELLNALHWRYAVKKMNGQAVPQEKVDQILEAARLAPTSIGLQPFRVIVITNRELKEKLQPLSFGQSQITDCSHLLVFAAWDNYTPERLDAAFAHVEKVRNLPAGAMNDFKNNYGSRLLSRSAEENFNHTARQAYIGFGMAIAAAAELQVDATPMEGFDNAQYDEVLGLKEQGLKSVTILPLGYRDEANDWLVKQEKVRVPKEEFIREIQ